MMAPCSKRRGPRCTTLFHLKLRAPWWPCSKTWLILAPASAPKRLAVHPPARQEPQTISPMRGTWDSLRSLLRVYGSDSTTSKSRLGAVRPERAPLCRSGWSSCRTRSRVCRLKTSPTLSRWRRLLSPKSCTWILQTVHLRRHRKRAVDTTQSSRDLRRLLNPPRFRSPSPRRTYRTRRPPEYKRPRIRAANSLSFQAERVSGWDAG